MLTDTRVLPLNPGQDTSGHHAPANTTLFALKAALDDCAWHPHTTERLLPDIVELAHTLDPSQRFEWVSNLLSLWFRHGWSLRANGLSCLMTLADAWHAWPLVRAIGQHLDADGHLPPKQALMLVRACRAIGEVDDALAQTTRLQLAAPRNERFADAHRALRDWQSWREEWGGIDGRELGEGDLLLEPMAHHHCADFRLQYFDPTISDLCCLPDFRDDDDWHQWLDDVYSSGDQRIDAVIHRDWGFIGSVSLTLHGGVGFFYYWLGRDFRGQGLGPRAARLLLAAAASRYGLHTCYAKVFVRNLASRRGLSKLGLDDIGFRATTGGEEERIFRCGPPRDRSAMAGELTALLNAMRSDTQVLALLGT